MTPQAARPPALPEPPSLARYVVVALLVPALLIGLFAWLRLEYARSELLGAQAARSYDRRIEHLALLSRIEDAETAQRGYLLTGDPAFLAPFEPARRDVERLLARDAMRVDPDAPADHLAAIRRLTASKFAELDATIRRFRQGDRAGARSIRADGRGRRIMDRLRAAIGALIGIEATRSAARRAAYLAYRSKLQRIVVAVIGVLAAIVLAALLSIWRLRRQRHASLLTAFEAFRRSATILDSTNDALLILDSRGTVEGMNAAATRMLGYAPAALEGRDIGVAIDLGGGGASFLGHVGLADGQPRQSFLPDRLARHRDGREVPVDVALGMMDLPSGVHLVVSLRDIAERKRIERMKDDLISTVGHELRTPLTSVIGSLGLLRAGAAGEMPAAAARLVEIAENNSRRLVRLINDMLDIDRIASGKLHVQRRPIDLRAVLDQACVGSEGLARSNDVAIACHGPAAPVVVAGDHGRLLQVMTNLASNAIRAAPRGSTVDLGLAQIGSTATVTVDDRGPGVPAAFRDRIFGRFERATPAEGATAQGGEAGSGTGLGLAISREIVTGHDGAIWFEDRDGGGTRFAFSLPLLAAAPGARPDTMAVLLCGQDDAVALSLIAIVAAEGCSYDLVRSPDEARAALAARRHAALLIAMSLPEAAGIAFAHGARDGDRPAGAAIIVVARATDDGRPAVLDVIDWVDTDASAHRLALAIRSASASGHRRQPLILYLDDDRALLDRVAAAIEPEARIVTATDLESACTTLRRMPPDLVIFEIALASGSALDLLPFLVDAAGNAIPRIVHSAHGVPPDVARAVDAVVGKGEGSLPELKAAIRRVLTLGVPR